jgi:hypothetical protein
VALNVLLISHLNIQLMRAAAGRGALIVVHTESDQLDGEFLKGEEAGGPTKHKV